MPPAGALRPARLRDKLRVGKRAHELRRAVDREVEPLPERAGAQALAAALRIARREHEAVAVDDAEARPRRCVDSDDCTWRDRALGLGRARCRRRCPSGADRLGRQPRARSQPRRDRLASRAASARCSPTQTSSPLTTVPSSASRLVTRVSAIDRVHAVVRPVAEDNQQEPDDHRGRVAPRLGLDQVRDDVRNRVGGRLGIAGADVEDARFAGGRRRRPALSDGTSCLSPSPRSCRASARAAQRLAHHRPRRLASRDFVVASAIVHRLRTEPHVVVDAAVAACRTDMLRAASRRARAPILGAPLSIASAPPRGTPSRRKKQMIDHTRFSSTAFITGERSSFA